MGEPRPWLKSLIGWNNSPGPVRLLFSCWATEDAAKVPWHGPGFFRFYLSPEKSKGTAYGVERSLDREPQPRLRLAIRSIRLLRTSSINLLCQSSSGSVTRAVC